MATTTDRIGNRTRYVCFDCGETSGAVMQVYRMIGPVGDRYRGVVMVHRTNTGCHRGETASAIREIR